ncbi:uncharacterized protein LOC131181332 [Hevea brasiliensis]|uniref:uncharacterized protein LOC131181332 n=1 Tax=Hevea brasiliensis TaxID=3981 RepID=UPI0025E2901F|nr:uncharacterized protein LOC131181332 [Hevea brasiliensis]
MLREDADSHAVLKEFISRTISTLQDWFASIGEYHKAQFCHLNTIQAVNAIFAKFLGDASLYSKQLRQEYFDMRCCSLKRTDIKKHYQRMAQCYYLLNGYNDVNLRHTYITSLSEALQLELHKSIVATRRAINTITIGEIHQMTLACLDKMCEQQKPKEKGHYKKYSSSFKPPFKHKKGRKPVRMNQMRTLSLPLEQILTFDPNYSLSSEESESETEAHNPSYLAQHIQSSHPVHSPDTIPIPLVPLHILPSRYERPISVIGFLDTGAHKSMMNPAILPSEYWLPHTEYFKAADGNVFKTNLITKQPIGIQFFPNSFEDPTNRIKYKRSFQPFTSVPRLYSLVDASAEFQEHKELLLRCCADSHAHFHHRQPLWKNSEFFVNLPFKLNENVNPTKASHPGMNPTDLILAQEECRQLLQQGLIEPTSFQWACQAFYVEKRSERLRGKKRLVIDYKPLNHFLQDDKFPLPKPEALFTQLHEAHVFSKFDLKTRFWQLGINLSDRPKIAFCIPTAQYQWTVLPFGLKTAPSVFQKAMTRIFEPILHSALIYIDDILLFSKDVTAHKELLSTFQHLVDSYGIMLSEKKSSLAQTDINFLGMKFKNGKCQPGPHIAEELLKFPDKDFSVKQIQQFLGIINYIRKFIPHVATHTSQLSKMLRKTAPPWKKE